MYTRPFLLLTAPLCLTLLALPSALLALRPISNDPSPLQLQIDKINGITPVTKTWTVLANEALQLSLSLDYEVVRMPDLTDNTNTSQSFEGSHQPPKMLVYKPTVWDLGRPPKAKYQLLDTAWAHQVAFEVSQAKLIGMAEGSVAGKPMQVVFDKKAVQIVEQTPNAMKAEGAIGERSLTVTLRMPASMDEVWFDKAQFYRLELQLQPTGSTSDGYRPFGVDFIVTNIKFVWRPALEAQEEGNNKTVSDRLAVGGLGIETKNAAHVRSLLHGWFKADDAAVLSSPKLMSNVLPWEEVTLSQTVNAASGAAYQAVQDALQDRFGDAVSPAVTSSVLAGLTRVIGQRVAASNHTFPKMTLPRQKSAGEAAGKRFQDTVEEQIQVQLGNFQNVTNKYVDYLYDKLGSLSEANLNFLEEVAKHAEVDPSLRHAVKDAAMQAHHAKHAPVEKEPVPAQSASSSTSSALPFTFATCFNIVMVGGIVMTLLA